eukprot:m.144376 g.144376  ORF g.144376 m.144376 type:complete len:568 (-) comp16766_c0_seq4:541-2244(-)
MKVQQRSGHDSDIRRLRSEKNEIVVYTGKMMTKRCNLTYHRNLLLASWQNLRDDLSLAGLAQRKLILGHDLPEVLLGAFPVHLGAHAVRELVLCQHVGIADLLMEDMHEARIGGAEQIQLLRRRDALVELDVFPAPPGDVLVVAAHSNKVRLEHADHAEAVVAPRAVAVPDAARLVAVHAEDDGKVGALARHHVRSAAREELGGEVHVDVDEEHGAFAVGDAACAGFQANAACKRLLEMEDLERQLAALGIVLCDGRDVLQSLHVSCVRLCAHVDQVQLDGEVVRLQRLLGKGRHELLEHLDATSQRHDDVQQLGLWQHLLLSDLDNLRAERPHYVDALVGLAAAVVGVLEVNQVLVASKGIRPHVAVDKAKAWCGKLPCKFHGLAHLCLQGANGLHDLPVAAPAVEGLLVKVLPVEHLTRRRWDVRRMQLKLGRGSGYRRSRRSDSRHVGFEALFQAGCRNEQLVLHRVHLCLRVRLYGGHARLDLLHLRLDRLMRDFQLCVFIPQRRELHLGIVEQARCAVKVVRLHLQLLLQSGHVRLARVHDLLAQPFTLFAGDLGHGLGRSV